MDPVWAVALSTAGATAISTAGLVLVALINKKPAEGVDSLRERISLRDEQIVELEEDLAAERAEMVRLKEKLSLRDEQIGHLMGLLGGVPE